MKDKEKSTVAIGEIIKRELNPHCSYPLCNSLISNIRIF